MLLKQALKKSFASEEGIVDSDELVEKNKIVASYLEATTL